MREITVEHHMDRSIVSYEGSDKEMRGASFWGAGMVGRANDYKDFVEDMLESIEEDKLELLSDGDYD